MKLTIVRHGETDYNKEGRLQGHTNTSLNDTGRWQCKMLKMELKDKHFDICFSSPLVRSVETAMILVGDKVEIKIDSRLKERNLGDFEGETKEGYDSKKYWDIELNSNDNNVEAIKDVLDRVDRFLSYLKENYNDKEILIVSHGAVVKSFHYLIKHEKLMIPLMKNCYVEQLEY